MKQPPDGNPQVAFRASPAMIKRLDKLVEAVASEDGGIGGGRSMVIRKAVLIALPQLESLHGLDERRAASRRLATQPLRRTD